MQLSLDTAMERTFSVGEFGQLLTDVLNHTFAHDVWIQGEVRDMNRAQSGHVYFTLVDPAPEPGRRPDATLPVVLFEGTKRTINSQIKRSGGGMRIEDGVAVRIRGVPDFYVPSGKLSLRMTGIDPAYTLGQMAASRERLLRALAEEGLISRNSSLPFPVAPLRIGLVTADGSAAQADFLHELEGSGLAFHVLFAATPVQGAGAAARVAASIRACERDGAHVIAVVRGGGARTDLIAFDDELVARAIAHCQVPVLTGIGHEIDNAVADEVAHLALKTPTACAAHLVALGTSTDRRMSDLWNQITESACQRLDGEDTRVTYAAHSARRSVKAALRESDLGTMAAAHRVRDLTNAQLDRAQQRLGGHLAAARLQSRHRLTTAAGNLHRAGERLSRAAGRGLNSADQRVDAAALQARLLDPARVLARGWSITTDARGAVIRSVADAPAGTPLRTRMADGQIASTVDDVPDHKEPS